MKPFTSHRSLYLVVGLTIMGFLFGCQSVPEVSEDFNTLSEIDIVGGQTSKEKVFIKPKTTEEIRKAYTDYLNNAVVSEESRLNALTRLAELEYSSGNNLVGDSGQDDDSDSIENKLYEQRLQRTIELLNTSLRDYPEAKGNDSLLYQLAKAEAQNGRYQESMQALTRLAEKYPRSNYYTEAHFRIAEDAFSRQDYSTAEYSYTEVIVSLNNEIFYEKSLFKRGWARFKQQYYSDAIEDYIQAVLNHEFGAFETLSPSDKDQFTEYFRAIALAFSYQNDTENLANYFKNRTDFRYTYHTYEMIGELYLKQERYSDAVSTHREFIKHFSNSENIPYSYLKIIEIWKNSGFNKQIYQAIEDFYVNYNPSSSYWVNQNENSKINRVIRRSLREYLVLMAGYYHDRYQSSRKRVEYANAEKWYQRYLTYYDAYGRQDNIFFLYAELLSQNKNPAKAFEFYEKAAFDNELILHKEAAYAAILVSDSLFTSTKNTVYLDKNLLYAKRFTQEFSSDRRTHKLALRATEQAFQAGAFKTTIELADLVIASKQQQSNDYVEGLKATAYFNLNEFEEAESIYSRLISTGKVDRSKLTGYRDNLALSIYRQGEKAQSENDLSRAIQNFTRISNVVPDSDIASTGLYDAIAIQMQYNQWPEAISSIEKFQTLYPKHKLSLDVSKKLSVAYLNSDQGVKAAVEFEKLARMDGESDVKAAALWKAAELYEEKNKISNAIKAYQDYASTFKKPYTQMIEAMNKAAELLVKNSETRESLNWYGKITQADEKALNNVRTEQTRYITSAAYLALARHEKGRFDRLKLSLPLKTSLKKKKTAMQNSVQLYGKASVNKIYQITTESTFSIAKIYVDFSQALINSDRPKTLNEEELDQYEILLEDQAFPFEDKSIEFFEINLARIREGLYDDWIDKSHKELIDLFPVRYNRQPKLDDYVAVME